MGRAWPCITKVRPAVVPAWWATTTRATIMAWVAA